MSGQKICATCYWHVADIFHDPHYCYVKMDTVTLTDTCKKWDDSRSRFDPETGAPWPPLTRLL